MKKNQNETFFIGLTALSESSFPKKCPTCNHIYESADEYIKLTQSIQGKSGLKASEDDTGRAMLELFRNCHCGSTLLDFFKDRRDTPEQRKLFDELLEQVCGMGIERNLARAELLKEKRGIRSDLLRSFQYFYYK